MWPQKMDDWCRHSDFIRAVDGITLDYRGGDFLAAILGYTQDHDALEKKMTFYTKGNILFLADKGDDHPEKTHALAPEIRLLGYNIYQTDNSFSQIQVTDENLTRIKVDHAQPFPFQEKKFDVIVMRRGLCSCDDLDPLMTCGGIHKDVDSLAQFLVRVIDILNLQNPRAHAILEGFHDILFEDSIESSQEALNFWIQTAKQTKEERPQAEIKIILDNSGTRFFCYHIQSNLGLWQSR